MKFRNKYIYIKSIKKRLAIIKARKLERECEQIAWEYVLENLRPFAKLLNLYL